MIYGQHRKSIAECKQSTKPIQCNQNKRTSQNSPRMENKMKKKQKLNFRQRQIEFESLAYLCKIIVSFNNRKGSRASNTTRICFDLSPIHGMGAGCFVTDFPPKNLCHRAHTHTYTHRTCCDIQRSAEQRSFLEAWYNR